MFEFFTSIFSKVTYLVASAIITVGLVSAPEPIVVPPVIESPVVQETQTDKIKKEPEVKAPKATEESVKKVIEKPVQKKPEPKPIEPILTLLEQKVIKELRIKADKSEIWASGFHPVSFSFEYLVNGKPQESFVYLESTVPAEPIGQFSFPSNKFFIYMTSKAGNHTLKFSSEGASAEITIYAKEWPNKQSIEIVPTKTENMIEAPNGTEILSPIFLGSFRIRGNPDRDYTLYDCVLTQESSRGIFEPLKVKVAEREADRCFGAGLLVRTDSNGLSLDEVKVYLDKAINKDKKWKFYLDNLIFKEIATGKFWQAKPLKFELETSFE